MNRTILFCQRKRRELKDDIAGLKKRHRKRKSLQRILTQLTTRQLRSEIRMERSK